MSDEDAILERSDVEEPWREIRRLQRALDRSRRATNPEHFSADGTVRTGAKRWRRSARYRCRQRCKAELERKLAWRRRHAHGQLANRVAR